MEIDLVLQLLNEVCDFAYRHYPAGDNRPRRLRKMGEELRTSIDDRQRRVMLTQIKTFLQGGQGSFSDVWLTLPWDSNLSYAEFSMGYQRLVGKLYIQVKQALEELSSDTDAN